MENLEFNPYYEILKIYFYGEIYFIWINKLHPEIRKHYLNAKRDVADSQKGQIGQKSDFSFWKRHRFTSKCSFPIWRKHISTSKCSFPFWKKYIITSKCNSPFWKKYISTSKCNFPFWKRLFCGFRSVLATALNSILDKWRRVSVHLQIYYSTIKSLIAALISSLRDSAFLHRNFPMIMLRITNRKQHSST